MSINCLNKSHVGTYGYSKRTLPGVDAFSENAYVFRNLVSPTTVTRPSLYELLTSRSAGDASDPPTPAVTDSPLLRYLESQGYHVYLRGRDFPTETNDPTRFDSPFVVFEHYVPLHCPYDLDLSLSRIFRGDKARHYRETLSELRDFSLTASPLPESYSIFHEMAFGRQPPLVPVRDPSVWEGLLARLKRGPGDPARDLLAARIPASTLRALTALDSSSGMTLRQKKGLLRALSRLARHDSRLIFNDATRFHQNGLTVQNLTIPPRHMLSAKLKRMVEEGVVRLGEEGRPQLSRPLTDEEERRLEFLHLDLLRLLYATPGDARSALASQGFIHNPRILSRWQESGDYEREREMLVDLYDARLPEADAVFVKRLALLKKTGVLDRTIVVFMGDHGEAFMEHGSVAHDRNGCYEEVISPPLILKPVEAPPARVWIDNQVRMVDLLPTWVELMGFELSGALKDSVDGRSLAGVLRGEVVENVAFSRSMANVVSARTNSGWKFIWNRETDKRELYDLKKDPRETVNLEESHPALSAELEDQLIRHLYK